MPRDPKPCTQYRSRNCTHRKYTKKEFKPNGRSRILRRTHRTIWIFPGAHRKQNAERPFIHYQSLKNPHRDATVTNSHRYTVTVSPSSLSPVTFIVFTGLHRSLSPFSLVFTGHFHRFHWSSPVTFTGFINHRFHRSSPVPITSAHLTISLRY